MAASTIVPLQGSTATQPTEVSIIMPAHNAAKTIKASVDSVLAQTHTDWKLHVVDDGSTDQTAEIIGTFAQADTRILLHRPGRLGSAGAARNHAMAQASSQYLAFLDADDLWLPQKLQRQLACLQSGNAIAVCSGYHVSADSGRTLSAIRTPPRRISRRQMLANNKVGCLTMLVDLKRTGTFLMPEGVIHEDYVTWLGLLNDPSLFIEGLQEPLAIYSVQPGSLSGNKLRAAGAQWHTYRKLLGMGLPEATFWMIQYALATGSRTARERLLLALSLKNTLRS
jgi:glycosyltransferase involved in cell wall biosynthesis